MFNRLLSRLSSYHLTFESWLLSVLGIIAVRIFLEQYSNNISGHYVLIDAPTIIQYATSFVAILLSSIAIILYFTKKTIQEIASLTLFAFMIIWMAPIIDIILSTGKGYAIHYIFLGPKDIFFAFISEFWTTTPDGMTYGIRIEILLVLIASFGMLYTFTKNIKKTICGTVLIWSSIFLVDCIPSFLGIFQQQSIPHFIKTSIVNSTIISNSIYSSDISAPRALNIGFDALMTQSCIVIIAFSIGLICLFSYRKKTKILLRNTRPERILHYVLLVVVGVILGGGTTFFSSWVNVLSLLMTMTAFSCAWLSAVCINDIEDISIDVISNKNRPLPQKIFTSAEFYTFARLFLFLALLAAYSASLYGLFFVILFSFVFYLYSCEPIKLKRHFVSGALVIGFASISALLSGFFLSTQNHDLFSFPPTLVLGLILFFGFSSMIKDLKDYDGDLANGIRTLPVVVGFKRSKIIIATVISVSMIGFALYLNIPSIGIASIVTSILVWIILMAKTYREKRFFIIYIAYLLFCCSVILF